MAQSKVSSALKPLEFLQHLNLAVYSKCDNPRVIGYQVYYKWRVVGKWHVAT